MIETAPEVFLYHSLRGLAHLGSPLTSRVAFPVDCYLLGPMPIYHSQLQRAVYLSAVSLLLLLVALIAITCHPDLLPYRDSGVFLYMGQRMLAGDVPYRDIVDHKGPLLYLLNAVGLAISGGAVWGIWLLQVVGLTCATLKLHRVLTSNFGLLSATVAMLLCWPVILVTIEGGNLTEVYSIPLQVAAIALCLRTFTKQEAHSSTEFFLLGVVLALSGLLRPINFGTPLIAASAALFGCTPTLRRKCAALLFLGALSPVAISLGYFAVNGALDEFIDLYIRYNLFYAGSGASALGPVSQVESARFGWALITAPGLSVILLLAVVSGLNVPTSKKNHRQRLTVIAVIALLLEFLFALISGTQRPHYFLMVVVPLSAACAAGIAFAVHLLARALSARIRLRGVLVLALIIALLIHPIRTKVAPAFAGIGNLDRTTASFVAQELRDTTQQYEYLLVWGAEATLNFLAKKPSPSQFVYLYPLMQCRASSAEMQILIERFTRDVIEAKPILIDASSTNPRIVPLRSSLREPWFIKRDRCGLKPSFAPLLSFIDSEYHELYVLPGTRWRVLAPNARRAPKKGGN
jgi:hypothetical protein